MKLLLVFAIVGVIAVGGYLVMAVLRRRRRGILLRSPFSQEWIAVLNKNLPPYRKLSSSQHQQLHDYINSFLSLHLISGRL